jgi:hypothetical protein
MNNHTDFNGTQYPYLESTDFAQNTHFSCLDLSRLPSLNTLDDLSSFSTDPHQTILDSTCGIVSNSKSAGVSLRLIYSSFRRCLLSWANHPSINKMPHIVGDDISTRPMAWPPSLKSTWPSLLCSSTAMLIHSFHSVFISPTTPIARKELRELRRQEASRVI